jgi:hypothetical protein
MADDRITIGGGLGGASWGTPAPRESRLAFPT